MCMPALVSANIHIYIQSHILIHKYISLCDRTRFNSCSLVLRIRNFESQTRIIFCVFSSAWNYFTLHISLMCRNEVRHHCCQDILALPFICRIWVPWRGQIAIHMWMLDFHKKKPCTDMCVDVSSRNPIIVQLSLG